VTGAVALPRGTALTRQELRLMYVHLDGRPGADVEALREKLRRMIAERAGERAWGPKVFAIAMPLHTPRLLTKGKRAGTYVDDPLAPTLNVYGSMKIWQRAALYKAIDLRILAEIARWPRARVGVEAGRRAVRVVRYSSAQPDEITVDVLGGKIAVDRLVQAGILAGDAAKDLEREAAWIQAPPGHGRLTVEVFELLEPGVAPP
jgi:hypothetical protein